jgi:tight adherence protein C
VTTAAWGALTGAGIGVGLVLVVVRILALRRPQLEVRVLPYVRDLPQADRGVPVSPRPANAFTAVFGPVLESAAVSLERLLGGNTSIRRRLERGNLSMTVHDFRVEQVLWGLVAFGATAAVSLLLALRSPGRTVPLVVVCGVASAEWRSCSACCCGRTG